ncbi:GGDEF domain-containing protein [Cellulomonas bogoriensis]|uniref:Diguanylate cyclase n=1 Tax=Cellulomonas bogoriensis 69B4 = DSM 16987 TaxID=1386082 RepID=A0A0A0BYR2_9CELL|nr:diguanylate cyclase [Cellulomonas bogoriensis]KGM13071.1 diguanylate cyclase [Cellulomonas bogoriensis 69B4 = DSM 16987]
MSSRDSQADGAPVAVLRGHRSGQPDGANDLQMMRRVAVGMLVGGGAVCLLGVWTTQATPVSQVSQAAVAVVLLLTGAVVAMVRRPTRRLLTAAAVWSVVVISVLVALSTPLGMAPVFYLWPVVFIAYFSTPRTLVATGLLGFVGLSAGLLLNPTEDLKLDAFIGVLATVSGMAALVAAMQNREQGLRRRLAVAAETDPLTGLLNRRSFDPMLMQAVSDAPPAGDLAVLMIDLDHFKRINDRRGHPEGDRVLQEVAAVLLSQSRQGDLVARLGGEEFAVALPGAGVDAARRYATRVADGLGALMVEGFPGVSASMGIAARSAQAEAGDTLLRRADAALYAAKHAGRHRAATWTETGIVVGAAFSDRVTAS